MILIILVTFDQKICLLKRVIIVFCFYLIMFGIYFDNKTSKNNNIILIRKFV